MCVYVFDALLFWSVNAADFVVVLSSLFFCYIVPAVPFLGYYHVGMDIALMGKNSPSHVIDYPTTHNWKQQREGIFQAIRTLPLALEKHSNREVLKLMRNAKKAFSATTLEDEYAMMWGLKPNPDE